MANPLARVVMNNVIKKTCENPRVTNPAEKNNNLTNREEDLLIGLIRGEKEVKEEDQRVSAISLDEAVEIVKSRK